MQLRSELPLLSMIRRVASTTCGRLPHPREAQAAVPLVTTPTFREGHRRSSTLSPCCVASSILDNPHEPAPEVARLDPVERSIRRKQTLLQCIVGCTRLARDAERHPPGEVKVRREEPLEGDRIPRPSRGEEPPPLLRRGTSSATGRGRLPLMSLYLVLGHPADDAAPLRSWRAEVAKWQTQPTQNRSTERSCGFDSHLRHQSAKIARAHRRIATR